MERDGIIEGIDQLPPPTNSVVALALNGSSKGKYVVRWALDKFVPEGMLVFKLLHVRPKITSIPTPMGNTLPISQVRDDVVIAFKKEKEWQANKKLLPYKNMCVQRKVQVEIIQIESDDIVTAIIDEITGSGIKKLVIGATSSGMFSRGRNLSSKIAERTPRFCTVYAVSKGKLSSVRASDSETIAPSDSETIGNTIDDSGSDTSSVSGSSNRTSSSQTEWTDQGSATSYSRFLSPPLPLQRIEALSNINKNLLHRRASSTETSQNKFLSPDSWEGEISAVSYHSNSEINAYEPSEVSIGRSVITDNQSWTSDQGSTSGAPTDFSSESQANINFELEKLRIELRHFHGMYAVAQNETFDASRKLNDLQKRRLEESIKLKEIKLKEEEAKELAEQERKKSEAAKREAHYVKERAKREAAGRKDAETQASYDSRENEKLQNAMIGQLQQYQAFTWDEITAATSSFSEDLKIGMGAYGTVYKSTFHHTVAAVKVLHSEEVHRTKQFHQELEILSKIRHPHLLILLGACVDRGCLVYEYMENGSLEERLFRKDGTPPIPWYERFRIAWEVASAIVFLHNSKPKSIVHRDLKPANILLDKNLMSKIGDVGLSTMLQTDAASSTSTIYKDTSPAGTLCYIDPEYQRTGLVSPKSDVYALGIIILQLLTAKPAIALSHVVETAMEDGHLAEVLDPEAGEWPVEETEELAKLGLSCSELRRRDRPDLKNKVLPLLERLKGVADNARVNASSLRPSPPNHFICPILKDVMDDPCVAADGYTYERKAIEKWFGESDNSPMTNLPLPNKHLIPNYTLLSAIMEWKSGRQ